jgi:hypothetical protein
VWRVGHTTRTNNAPAARFGPTQSSFAKTMLLSPHEPNGRCNSGINGRRGDGAIAGAESRDDIGMPPDMVREDALIAASIMIAAVAGISSRKVRQ